MKKIIYLFLFISSNIILLTGCNSVDSKYGSGASFSQASIASEDFVKQKLSYPEEAEFQEDRRGEETAKNEFMVYQQFTAKNAFGVKTLYTYKVKMKFKGGEWTDNNNWEYADLVIENTTTHEQQSYEGNMTYSTNGKSVEELCKELEQNDPMCDTIAGIRCKIIELTSVAIRYGTPKKLSIKQMKAIWLQKRGEYSTIQYCDLKHPKRGQEYASFIGDTFFNFDTGKIIKASKLK